MPQESLSKTTTRRVATSDDLEVSAYLEIAREKGGQHEAHTSCGNAV